MFTTQRRVEFRDTDAAGIMHFSVFFSLMEEVEHEFLRSVGLRIISQYDGQTVSWPRVHAECDYRRPVGYDDQLEIELSVDRIGAKSVSYGFRFFHQRQLIAEGSITAACCRVQSGQPPASIVIPPPFAQALAQFQAAHSG